ncbi:MAG: hypothetical protein M3N32_08960 [Actinomycetota bacterium]|nr:hypothetical protein [Actinomycetota bacterium]
MRPCTPRASTLGARRLPRPAVSVNPGQRGLTGLETFFWYDDSTADRLEPVDHDGSPANARDRPAARYVLDTKGRYTITVETRLGRQLHLDRTRSARQRQPRRGPPVRLTRLPGLEVRSVLVE